MISFNDYYMLIALAVRERANCVGRKVGAVIVRENRIIGTGYNGTPEGLNNCKTDGCVRCNHHRKKGLYYDMCICVHAEQNALISCARLGCSVDHAEIYTTTQPCFTCLKLLLQAKAKTVYYMEELYPKDKKILEPDFQVQYEILLNRFEKYPTKLKALDLLHGLDEIKNFIADNGQ